ncbi:MAG: phenylalanine--tRNA ligase subunit beta [Pseudonocardiaceae bacterium]
MKAPVRWLRELVAFSESEETIAERLSVAGLEVESIDTLPDGDAVLDIDILPNMARCLAMVGIAREVAAITGAPLRIDVDLADLPSPRPDLAPRIVDSTLCGRFAILMIDGVDDRDAPDWLRDRVRAAGMDSVSGLVDLANYVMLEIGQPLHVYDRDRLGGPRLGVRAAREGDSLRLLTRPEAAPPVALPVGVPVIVDQHDTPVTAAGLVGGRPTAVTPSTTSVVVEAASFDFLSIRRAQTALGLVTDASARFSRGVDPELVETGLRRFCALLREVNPDVQVHGYGETRPQPPNHRTIQLDVNALSVTIGATYTPDDVAAVLDRLGLTFDRMGTVFSVSVGDERADLRIPHDLMEEVVRIHGLGHVPATMPHEAIPAPVRERTREGHTAIRQSLIRGGLCEVISYTLSSPAAHSALGGPAAEPLLPLLNPLSSELTALRRSLLPGLLMTVEGNLRSQRSVHVFEHGVVVLPEYEGTDPGLPREQQRVAVAMVGDAEPEGLWSDARRPVDLYDVTDVVLGLVEDLHIEGVRLVQAKAAPYLPAACAAVVHGEQVLGHLGMLRDDVAATFGLGGQRVFAAELDADALVTLRRTEYVAPLPSRYPSALLDLSVAVSTDVAIGDVVGQAMTAGGDELSDVSVFDIFAGTGLPEGRKAVGLRLTINAGDRTLTTREAEGVRERVLTRLVDVFAAQRR